MFIHFLGEWACVSYVSTRIRPGSRISVGVLSSLWCSEPRQCTIQNVHVHIILMWRVGACACTHIAVDSEQWCQNFSVLVAVHRWQCSHHKMYRIATPLCQQNGAGFNFANQLPADSDHWCWRVGAGASALHRQLRYANQVYWNMHTVPVHIYMIG